MLHSFFLKYDSFSSPPLTKKFGHVFATSDVSSRYVFEHADMGDIDGETPVSANRLSTTMHGSVRSVPILDNDGSARTD